MSQHQELMDVAGRMAHLQVKAKLLFEGADALTGAAKSSRVAEIRAANDELAKLADRRDALSGALKVQRMEAAALRAMREPVSRQVLPDNDDNPSAYGAADDSPGTVRGIKSTDSFASTYGGSTPVTLDRYLRAAFSGHWEDLPDSLWAGSGRKEMATDALGTLVLPTPLSNRLIDLSRSASRVIAAGATTVRMSDGTLTFGRLTQAPTPAWKLENALIAASDAEFEPVTLTARTLAARVTLSVELAEDSPTIGSAIESALSAELGSELDRAALKGTGTAPEPRGLLNMPGITTIDTSVGLPADYSDFSRAVQTIREANEEPNAVIYGPDVAGELERLTNSLGDPLTPPESFQALRKLTTTKLADTAAIGDWSQFVVGLRQDLRIEATRQGSDENGKGFGSYSVLVRATLRADFAVLKPGAFVVLTDINNNGS